MPYPNIELSAAALDRMRLGKQRVEVKQIYKALTFGGGWANHPAVKMWNGYRGGLLLYGIAVCKEWIQRGYKDTLLSEFELLLQQNSDLEMPAWFGDDRLHRSHRSNLTRKFPEYYSLLWNEPNNIKYFWPI